MWFLECTFLLPWALLYVVTHSSYYFSHLCVSVPQIKNQSKYSYTYLCLINLLLVSTYMDQYQVISSCTIGSLLTFNSVCTNKTFINNAKIACDFI